MNEVLEVGDIVYIKKELPEGMHHFKNDVYAIIIEYEFNDAQDEFEHQHQYGVYIKDIGMRWWYSPSCLVLLEKSNYNFYLQGKK